MIEDSFSLILVNSGFPHVGHRLMDRWDVPEFMTYYSGKPALRYPSIKSSKTRWS
jgi:hypothetical protein